MDKNTSYLKDKSTISTPKGKFAYFFLSKHSKYQNITECNIKNHLQNVLSKWHWPEGPPPAPPPSWARKEFCVVVCAALLTFVCMLRYSEWNVVPIWFLYSSVLMVVRWADPVSVFFDTYRNILYQSDISGQDAQSASIPPHVFSCRLEASARGRWHRAGLLRRRGDYYLDCGRRRYCGRVCCLSRRRVLALPQCF